MHKLNCDDIDQVDEINGDAQLALVWCRTHDAYEWHSIPRDMIDGGGSLAVTTNPVAW